MAAAAGRPPAASLSFVEDNLPRRHLPVATLQKLDQEQIDRFIENWYCALQGKEEMTAAEAENKDTARLRDASRGYLHELAQNPMLLTIMAIVQTYEGTLPDERAMLYQALRGDAAAALAARQRQRR